MSTSPSTAGPTASGAVAPADAGPIVVGIDGSPGSIAALRWAATEARCHGRPLTAIYVLGPPAYYGFAMVPMPDMGEALMEGAQAGLEGALMEVFGDQRPADLGSEVREGDPAEVMIGASTEASLLVVGARGRGGFLLGSVTDRCVHHAVCPVVVVRE
jgi:nucleotide-binding universal stress UspA family protein